MRLSRRYGSVHAFVPVQRILQNLQKSPCISRTGDDSRVHSRLRISLVELGEFQDHLKCVVARLEVVRVPALCSFTDTARTRLLWHFSLQSSVALGVPPRFSLLAGSQIHEISGDKNKR